ncbi:MAG: peptidase family protein [Acidimicrobiales bacterium]|nr:peptidase family protein [Acidimicrobiales bacterium]
MKPRIGITSWPRPAGDRTEPSDTVPRAYVRAVERAGGLPILLPLVDPTDVEELLTAVDGVVVTGGGDVDPARYGAEPHPETGGIDAARDAFDAALWDGLLAGGVPALGICRAIQILNVALGGTLHQHMPEHRLGDGLHRVEVRSRLAEVIGATTTEVNSLHHQAIDRLADGLTVTAQAADGGVEGVEVDGHRQVLAVQWHPELLRHRPDQLALFEDLVSRASSR